MPRQSRHPFLQRWSEGNGAAPFAITLLDTTNKVVVGNLGNTESGSLIPGASSDPFELTLVHTPQNVTYGVLGEAAAVVLDGTVTLSTAWNLQGEPDVLYTFGLSGNALSGPISLFQQPPQELAVGVELSANDRWIIKGSGLI